MAERGAVRIGRLTTVLEVASELGRVYRGARHKKIDAAFAYRLANILAVMRQCLETAEFERRIAEIEAQFGKTSAGEVLKFPRIVP
jgi:inhibitor of KinA sporulation pathway (predicted exonuclease)